MKTIKKLRKKFWFQTLVSALAILSIAFILASTLAKSIEKYKEESGKTIMYRLGKEVNEAKQEFMKGYTNDTISHEK